MVKVVGIGREDRFSIELAADDGKKGIHHRQAEHDDPGEAPFDGLVLGEEEDHGAADIAKEHGAGVAHEDGGGVEVADVERILVPGI